MNNNKTIFNMSIVGIMLMLIFIYISISTYQLSYKTNQIVELNEVVKSQRKITQEIVKKNYPQIEDKIDDLVNLEKYKKLNKDLQKKNSGAIYLEKMMSDSIKKATRLNNAKKYEALKQERIKLKNQILSLKGNTLTVNILQELHQQNKPLPQQIKYLENKVKDNYKNKLTLSKSLQKFKTNEKIKYILLKLNKYDAPQEEQMRAIQKELAKYEKRLLGKNYKSGTTKYVLKNLKQTNKPIQNQIEALKQSLKNKKLLLEVEKLKKQLAGYTTEKKYALKTPNLKKALKNLERIKSNNTATYNQKTKDILQKLGKTKAPLVEQIYSIQKKLDKNLKSKNNIATNLNLQKALDNLQHMKNDVTATYNQNQKLQQQLDALENKIDKNNLVKDSNITQQNIEKALNDLTKIKNSLTDSNAHADKIYRDKLKTALDNIMQLQKLQNKYSSSHNAKPVINKNIENTIQYLEDKADQPNLKTPRNVQKILNKFHIKDAATPKQLSNLYLNLYTNPSDKTNISELNFVINRLKDQYDLEDQVKHINNFLKQNDTSKGNISENTDECKDNNSKKEILSLQNKIKYLQKKLNQIAKVYLPCFLDNDGSSIFLFILSLRDNNIHIELGKHKSVKELSKNLPNIDKLVGKTMSLKKFMKLTKPIFEESVQDECRQFVYFIDETISKKEYKRKTLTIQHHFYKYIDPHW